MRGAPAVSTVRQALDSYLSANGFDVSAYDAPTYEVDMAEVTHGVIQEMQDELKTKRYDIPSPPPWPDRNPTNQH